jgi:hypothetical protein
LFFRRIEAQFAVVKDGLFICDWLVVFALEVALDLVYVEGFAKHAVRLIVVRFATANEKSDASENTHLVDARKATKIFAHFF